MLARFVLLAALSTPGFAHHSFAAQYDAQQPVTLKGSIKKFDWVNPHSWIIVEAKNADGKVETWECEAGAPSILRRRGWKPSTLKQGDQVTINGFRAKDGSHTMNATAVLMADGTQVLAGSSGDGAPPANSKADSK